MRARREKGLEEREDEGEGVKEEEGEEGEGREEGGRMRALTTSRRL